uniref:Fibronectin type-III domain-containing protein n=1 Tax=Eptatretus burgeri TaxID=7764 RepID=A0A8C4QPT5_EPTBU
MGMTVISAMFALCLTTGFELHNPTRSQGNGCTVLLKAPECRTRRGYDLICTWAVSQPETINSSFTYHYPGQAVVECPVSRLPTENTASGMLRCTMPEDHIILYEQLLITLILHNDSRILCKHAQPVSPEDVVCTDPPENLTARATSRPGELLVSWIPPDADMIVTATLHYQLAFQRKGIVTQVVTSQLTCCELSSLRPGVPYVIRIRAAPDGISFRGSWSEWSTAVEATPSLALGTAHLTTPIVDHTTTSGQHIRASRSDSDKAENPHSITCKDPLCSKFQEHEGIPLIHLGNQNNITPLQVQTNSLETPWSWYPILIPLVMSFSVAFIMFKGRFHRIRNKVWPSMPNLENSFKGFFPLDKGHFQVDTTSAVETEDRLFAVIEVLSENESAIEPYTPRPEIAGYVYSSMAQSTQAVPVHNQSIEASPVQPPMACNYEQAWRAQSGPLTINGTRINLAYIVRKGVEHADDLPVCNEMAVLTEAEIISTTVASFQERMVDPLTRPLVRSNSYEFDFKHSPKQVCSKTDGICSKSQGSIR